MEEIRFSEQDLINAICLHVASKRQIQPGDVTVELMWDEDHGFSAEVEVLERQQVLVEANLIEAVRFYLQTAMSRNPYSAAITFVLDEEEGIITFAKYNG